MGRDIFKNLAFIDQNLFAELFEAWGFCHAACYRLQGKTLVFTMGSSSSGVADWPATFDPVSLHYTDSKQDLLPFGWHKTKRKTTFGRNTIFYAPEQEGQLVKILFVLVPRDKLRRENGQLDGAMEALAKRIVTQLDQSETRQFFHESLMAEHASKLSRDTKVLIDHELRTPVSTIAGYAHLLGESSEVETQSAARVILDQVNILLASVEKLSSTVGAAFETNDPGGKFGQVPVADLLTEVAQSVALHVKSERAHQPQPECRVVIERNEEGLLVLGNRERLYRALWEVIHNAFIYSLNTRIEASLYSSSGNLIVDIRDGGVGVPKGSEDLIFLQFYKGQSDLKVRRGHRGLGLGLFLARHIVEQHGGQLLLVRQAEKGTLFRFLLPRFETHKNLRVG